jgi:hypothetical protein
VLHQRPQWAEPPPSADLVQWQRRKDRAWNCLAALPIVVLLALISALGGTVGTAVCVLLFGVVGIGLWCLYPHLRYGSARQQHDAYRAALFGQFGQAHARWEWAVADHDRCELERVSTALLWYPLQPRLRAPRIDVFGGTPDGWASLLATVGAGLLRSGGHVVVVDFTEHHVARELGGLAASQRCPVQMVELPGVTHRYNIDAAGDARLVGPDVLLTGLGANEVADLIAEALHTLRSHGSGGSTRGHGGSIDLRTRDAVLVRAVCERLDEPIELARIEAGLRVLSRLYQRGRDNLLTDAEFARLNSHVDDVGKSDTVADELQLLIGLIGLLVTEDGDPAGRLPSEDTLSVWPNAGMAVLATSSPHSRRKDLLDRLVFQRVLHDLRTRNFTQRNANRKPQAVMSDALVIAGADHMGLESLEELSRHAKRAGLRLVLMIEHLRDELVQLLGGSDSATVIMRLGNAAEASAAAEYIGKGYKFVLSQLTDQVGKTFTDGTSVSSGISTGSSYSTHFAQPFGGSNSTSRGWNWSQTSNWSQADSTGTGRTQARVYEYTVEPTTIQTLPTTAFLMVEPGRTGRRAIAADCNPGIVLLDRVAPVTPQDQPPPQQLPSPPPPLFPADPTLGVVSSPDLPRASGPDAAVAE